MSEQYQMEGGHRGLAWRKGPHKPGDRDSLTVAAAATGTSLCKKLCATHCPAELSPMQATVRKIRSVANLKSRLTQYYTVQQQPAGSADRAGP